MTRAAHQLINRKHLPDWSLVRRALFIRLRSIGDTVLMTASLRALKSWRPDIEVAVLSEPLSAPVLEEHPLVDKLIIAEKSFASRARLILRLRRERFDVAFNMHGGTTATVMAALAGAKHTVGYRGYRHSWMLGARAPSPDVILGRDRLHSVEQQLALLHATGVPWPAERPLLSLSVCPEAEARVRNRLKEIGASERAAFACVSPAAAMESKRWATDGFAAVADHLDKNWGLHSVIIAGPGQERIARDAAAATQATARVLTGLSLKELIALIGMAQVFVGNDSGPMHIAAALRRPLVAIFGSSNADVWHPWTDSAYRVVGGREEIAIRNIPVSRVISAVDEVLESAPAASFKADANLSNE